MNSNLGLSQCMNTMTQDEAIAIAHELIGEYAERLKNACTAHAARILKKEMNLLLTTNFLTDSEHDWLPLLKAILETVCFSCLDNQLKYTPNKYRKEISREDLIKKAKMCGISDQLIYQLLTRNGFSYPAPEILVACGFANA